MRWLLKVHNKKNIDAKIKKTWCTNKVECKVRVRLKKRFLTSFLIIAPLQLLK